MATKSLIAAVYLSDPGAVGGATRLGEQLRKILAWAARARLKVSPASFYFDSGRLKESPTIGVSLLRLLEDAGSGRLKLLIVDGLSRFAAEKADADAIAAEIRKRGCVLLDASALLRPGIVHRRMAVGAPS